MQKISFAEHGLGKRKLWRAQWKESFDEPKTKELIIAPHFQIQFAHSAGAVEYTDCTSAGG